MNKRLDIGLKDVLNMVYACFVLQHICDVNVMTVDAEDVECQIARDRVAQSIALADRLYNLNLLKGFM